jgi:protein-disulfide isomerase
VFFVNGHRYVGAKTEPQWRAIVDAELEQAEQLVDRGTPRANVYATMMQDALVRDDAPKPDARSGDHDPNAVYGVTTGDRAQLGPSDALVTIVTFSDFQCPFCSRLADTVHQVVERNPDVRVVFRNLPLDMHPRARECAKAALAAGRQDKYWEMHDAMFEVQKQLGSIDFADLASKIGIDTDRFASDMADPELDRIITEDEAVARQFRVRGTPAAFVNGRFMGGAQPVDVFEAIIEEERAKAQRIVDGGTARTDVYAEIMKSAQSDVAQLEKPDTKR